jgi:ribulose kinase
MKKFILALDQGTTSSRAIVFDKNGIGEVPDRIGVILLRTNPAWYEKVEEAEAPFISEQKPESKERKKREPKADSDVGKQEFLATIK